MSVKFLDTWEPNGPFPIVKDEHIKGGLRAVADDTERDAIPTAQLTVGQLIWHIGDATFYRLASIGPNVWLKLFAHQGANYIDSLLMDSLTIGSHVITYRESRFLNKSTRDSSGAKRSFVISGFELFPRWTATGNKGVFTAMPGVILTANDQLVQSAADITADTNATGNFISGSLPTYPCLVYAFARFKSGDGSPVLRLTDINPDFLGRPSGAEAGYTVNDYVYVGCQWVKTATGTYDQVWGSQAWAQSLGDGKRLVHIPSDVFVDGNNGTYDEGAPGTLDIAPPSDIHENVLPTARSILYSLNINILADSDVGDREVMIKSEGLDLFVELAADEKRDFSFSHEITPLPVQPIVNCSVNQTGGPPYLLSVDITVKSSITGFTENINEPIPPIPIKTV